MRKIILLIIGVLYFIVQSGCEHTNEQHVEDMQAAPDMAVSQRGAAEKFEKAADASLVANKPSVDQVRFPPPVQTVQDATKKIIKRGDINFEAEDIKATRSAIVAALKKAGGYVSQESETTDGEDGRKEYTLSTQIPAKSFDTFLSDVSNSAAHIDSKNISTEDVTAQYIDITTRLQNKKALEARYLALLKQANKMGDILEVENKLTDIRSDIESQQGQLNYLNKQVAYSSLDITFYAKSNYPVGKGYGVAQKFSRALANGWYLLQDIFFGIIGLWPVLVIIGALVWAFRIWRRRRDNS